MLLFCIYYLIYAMDDSLLGPIHAIPYADMVDAMALHCQELDGNPDLHKVLPQTAAAIGIFWAKLSTYR